MPQRGTVNNPNGRPKGAPNKMTADLRSRISDFLNQNWDQIENDFKGLPPEKRVLIFEKLLQYSLPKLQTTELIGNMERLSDDQLDLIINELKTATI